MKIAIVCGHFMPEIGYQEVYLTKAFAKAGHDVTVFASTEISPSGKKIINAPYKEGVVTDKRYGFKIRRLKTKSSLNSKVVSHDLKKYVKDFSPDVIILLAIAKLFPMPILSDDFKSAK